MLVSNGENALSTQFRQDEPGEQRTSANSNLPARTSYIHVPLVARGDGETPVLLEYWRMLRCRRGSVLLIACLGLILGVLIALPQRSVYQAHSTLEIQSLNENFLNMRDVTPTDNQGSGQPLVFDLETQMSLLQSESVLKGVIADRGLAAKLVSLSGSRVSPWRNALHLGESKSALDSEDIVALIRPNLQVRSRPNTRLIEIRYDSYDPHLAADVVNGLTAAYIQQNLESHWKTTQQTGEWLTRQMEDIRLKLEKSEAQLQAYARTSGLLFTAEKDNVAEARLRQLQEELSRAQADRIIAQSKAERAVTAPPDSLPEVLDDGTLKDYQAKVTELRRQLAELSSALTPSHPSVKKVEAQLAILEAERDRTRTNITRRIQNEFAAAQQRERLLAAGYDSQALLVSEQAAKATHYDILKREVDNNRQIYDSMLQHVKEADVASALHASNVRVVDLATPPTKPYRPNLVLNSTLGLFVGIVLGGLFAVVRGRTDGTIQAPGEASLLLNVPELGVIPSKDAERSRRYAYYRQVRSAHPREGGRSERKGAPKVILSPPSSGSVELITLRKRPSVLAEAFRSTLASILYSGDNDNRPRVIAITSANPREGKTTISCNLAVVVAEIGRRVLLVDGDLRRPRLHDIFKVSNASGLSDLLAGSNQPKGGIGIRVDTAYSDILLLPAGPMPSCVSGLLHSSQALELFNNVRNEFDVVIIDTPPLLDMPDARVLGKLADAVILVVRSAQTSKKTAAEARYRLAEDGTRVLGTILNEWDPRKMDHFGCEHVYWRHYYESSRNDGSSPSAPLI